MMLPPWNNFSWSLVHFAVVRPRWTSESKSAPQAD
jgi:hypothetical protein